MEALRYSSELHYREICEWSLARGVKAPAPSMLPKLGRIVPGKAAVFLYQTDSLVGFMESLISNPDQRDAAAIDACVSAIESDAKSLGLQYLVSTSNLSAVANRAERLGYQVSPPDSHTISKRLI